MVDHDDRNIRALEDELKVRFGIRRRGQSAPAGGRFSGSPSVRGMLRRMGAGSRPGGKAGAFGGSGQGRDHSGNSRQQRVIVKASYTPHHRADKAAGALRAHVSYLSRDSASLDGQPGKFYEAQGDAEGIHAKEARHRLREQEWDRDSRHFRLIISPEHGELIQQHPGGMKQFVREVMERMERDLKTRLQWLAIDHHNTDEPHAHVLLRGVRDNGQALTIPRDYIRHGLREAAQEIATRWLGERTAEQVNEAQRKEIAAERYTPLDAAIERNLDEQRRLTLPGSPQQRARIAARLKVLERYGLVERRRGQWIVSPELRPTLSDLSVRGDIIKNLSASLGHRAASVMRFEAGEREHGLTGTVIATGADDELRDRRYLLVRDAADQLHYVRVANREAVSVLECGGVVRVSAADPHRLRSDQRIAEIAQSNNGIYSTEAHRRSLPSSFAPADAESFLRSHERRLQTLTKLGAAVPKAGGWRIAEPSRLIRGEYARSHDGQGIIEIVSARSVASQITAEAWTWLDRQIHLQSRGKPTLVPLDSALEQAVDSRRQWMVEHGYAARKAGQYALRTGAAQTLRQKEWALAAPGVSERFGATACPLPTGAEATGRFLGTVSLHGGLYAAVNGGSQVHLAPIRRVPPLAYGASVRVQVSSRGLGVLSAAAPASLTASRALERE